MPWQRLARERGRFALVPMATFGRHRDLSSPDSLDTPALPASARQQFVDVTALHAAAMIRVATTLLGVDDAEDAAQEALVRAWRAWPTMRSPDAARAWLLRITVNVCREWRRGKRGNIIRLTQPLPDEVSDVTGLDVLGLLDDDPGSSDHAGAMDLRQAIRQLPLDFRVVIALRYYAGLEPHEIAAALNIPAATVRTRQFRALAMLRGRLEGASVRIPAPRPRQEDQ